MFWAGLGIYLLLGWFSSWYAALLLGVIVGLLNFKSLNRFSKWLFCMGMGCGGTLLAGYFDWQTNGKVSEIMRGLLSVSWFGITYLLPLVLITVSGVIGERVGNSLRGLRRRSTHS